MNRRYGLQFSVRIGPKVDRYLASEGAVAQALDSRTVLISSSIFELNRIQREKILLHELAHLQQLARPGNDPVRALEDEAWEAARAWGNGRPFKIRGRSRSRLNAVAIIQADASKKHPDAQPWYKMNPVEPLGNGSSVTVSDFIEIEDISLDSIMDAIIQKKDSDVVIVCHGFETELAIPLLNGYALGTIQENVARLSADRSFSEGGINTPVIADDKVAGNLSAELVKGLRAKMNQIRGMKLNHVAFRSCDMGKSKDTLSAFRLFFQAASVSAPQLYDAYGHFTPDKTGNVEAWAARKRKEGYRVWVDQGVAVGVKQDPKNFIKFKIVAATPDNSTFLKWVIAHVADRAGSKNYLVYHGIQEELQNVADPTAAIIHFVRDPGFASKLTFYSG